MLVGTEKNIVVKKEIKRTLENPKILVIDI